MSFSIELIPRPRGFSFRAARQCLAPPGRLRGRVQAAAMAAPVVPESDSVRRAVSLLNAVDPGRFPRLLSRLLQKLHLKSCIRGMKQKPVTNGMMRSDARCIQVLVLRELCRGHGELLGLFTNVVRHIRICFPICKHQ